MKNYRSEILNTFTKFVLACLLAVFAYGSAARSQTLDPTFQGNIQDSASVRASAVQTDGKILIAGAFTFINNSAKNNILRLNADGSLDTSFDAGAGVTRTNNPTNASIAVITLQSDGKILIGGFFDNYNGVPRNRLARLNTNGSLDTSFNIAAGGGATINSIASQPDGKILIGGDFSNYNGTSQTHFARLNSDGSSDVSFNTQSAGADNTVSAIFVQPDGKILIGGNFANYGTNPRSRIARINADGTFDTSFNNGAGASAVVSAISLQSDGKILIGGSFVTVNGTIRGSVARLNSDASLDGSFNPVTGANGSVSAIAVQNDGGIFISGGFTTYNGTARNKIARLNADGSLDAAFNPGAGIAGGSATVLTFVVQANKIYVGGSFRSYHNVARSGIVQLNSDGSLDASFGTNLFFNTNVATGAATVVLQPDGKILIGGVFAGYDGVVRNGIVRLSADGALDVSFNPGTGIGDGGVTKIVPQPDGKILIVGLFTSFNGVPQKNIVRLNSDGSLDATFNVGSGANDSIIAIALQANGKMLIGGFFTNFNGVAAKYIVRLNADGSVDSSFNTGTGPGSIVQTIAVQPSNGKILIGGIFTSYNGFARNGIARLNADGSLDDTFITDISPFAISVNLIVLQPNPSPQLAEKILITGSLGSAVPGNFTRLNSDGSRDASFNTGTGPNSAVNSVVVQPDGKILIGGGFTSYNGIARNRMARLNPDGSPDSFNACTGGPNADVTSIALQSDRVLAGGYFTTLNGATRNGIARVFGNQSSSICSNNRRTPFDFDGDGKADYSVFRSSDKVWYLDRSTEGFTAARFGLASDKLAPADYDADGKTDIAVWRESEGNFYIINSSNNSVRIENFGLPGDKLTVDDWDGDGKADLSVYRDSAVGSQSYFYYRGSLNNPSGNITYLPWGTTGDKPLRGDYDGDGKQDAAVFRPSVNQWIIRNSSNSQVTFQSFGLSTDSFVPADYDGDGKTDLAVFRGGTWYILQSSNNQVVYQQFGLAADQLVPADYDGDGKTDIAVWRSGQWWFLRSSDNGYTTTQFGLASDSPVPAAYLP